MKWRLFILVVLTLACLVGCQAVTPGASLSATPTQSPLTTSQSLPPPERQATVTPTMVEHGSIIASTKASPSTSPVSINPTPKPLSTLGPGEWQILPVIPDRMDHIQDIYGRGLSLGNNPNAFSKIGDCGSTPAWFLGDFDRGPRFYNLGEYTELEEVIQAFQGSYSRTSLAAKAGFNASSVFSLIWSDRAQCNASETPLACEYRIHRPMYAFITLGSNDVYHQDTF